MADNTEKLVLLYEAQNKSVLRALDQVKRAQKKAFNDNNVRKFNRSVKGSGAAVGKVSKTFSQAGRSVAVLEGPLGGVAGRFSAIAGAVGAVNPVLAVAAVTFAAAGAGAFKSVKAFEAFETQQLRLSAVLKATDGSAGRTSAELEKLAQVVGMDTLASTSGVRDAIAQLLTFRSVAGDTFERTIKLSQDLAAVGFGNLSSSAVQLGKALEDPATGLSALKRVGVSFTQAQKEMINNFVATGEVAQAQNAILDAVEKQVGGAGTAAGGGLAGAYDGLAEATGILLERWGKQVVAATGLKDAIRGIAGAVDEVNQKATLPGQLESANNKIAHSREVIGAYNNNPHTAPWVNPAEEQEKVLNDLLTKRKEILRKIDRQSVDAFDAYSKGLQAKELAANERVTSVLSSQKKIIEQAQKTPLQRVIDTNLSSAGVSADSDDGKRIVETTKRAFAMQAESAARTKTATAAQKQSDKVAAVIEALRLEGQQMTMNDTQRRIQNELISAGTSATAEQQAEITALVAANDDLAQKQSKAAELASFMGQQVSNQFDLITSQIKTGNSALDTFLKSMADAAIQAAAFGSGPLSGVFGGGTAGSQGAGIFGAVTRLLGFSEGGYTGDGGKFQPKGVVHGGEYVFSKEATKKIGVSSLAALHKTAKGFSAGGYVGGHVPTLPAQASVPRAQNQSKPAELYVFLHSNSYFDEKMTEISGNVAVNVVKQAAPGLIATSTEQAGGQVIGNIDSHNQNRGGDWR